MKRNKSDNLKNHSLDFLTLKPDIYRFLDTAKIQDMSKYAHFITRLNDTLEIDRMSILSNESFDEKTKVEVRRKNRMTRLSIWKLFFGASTVALFIATLAYKVINPEHSAYPGLITTIGSALSLSAC